MSVNFERGSQLFEMGRYKEAIPFLSKSLAENVDDYHSKYLIAQCYFMTNDIERALKLALELRSENPEYSDIYFLLSQLHFQKNNIKEALINIDNAIGINPYEENYFGQKSYIKLSEKKFNEALNLANEGLKINAKSDYCLNARATALTKLKRTKEAEETIENLLQENPEDSNSHANVGWNYLEKNDIPKALNHFKEALKLDPASEYARDGMLNGVKAKNSIYNLYLRYAFWIGNKSEKNQWYFIIGIYLAYRFLVKMLSVSGFAILSIPLIIAYLLFALGSWIMEPLSNMILIFDKYGKYLLDDNDKLSGQIMFYLLIGSLSFFGLYLGLNNDYYLLISISCLAAILPLTRYPLFLSPKTRNINLAYGSLIILIAICGSFIGYSITTLAIVVGVLFIAYTWLGNFISRF